MLIGKFNTLQFFEDKTLQRWENADNKYILTYFALNKMPSFVLISDTSETTAKVQLFNADTDIALGAEKTVSVSTNGTKKMLYFAGDTLTGGEECFYYLKISTGLTGVETYYSEVFGWVTDSTANLKELNMIKISATSSSITLGTSYSITIPVYECMIKIEGVLDEEPDIEEEGNEKPYGDIPVFNTLSFRYSAMGLGSKGLFRFLCGLRILKTNGSVVFTYRGISIDSYDIICEKEESTEDTVSYKLEYRDTDYISSRNA